MNQENRARAILIVEDEIFIRHDLVDFFEDRGFIVFDAQDADEAVEVLSTRPEIRIVLTDVQMPGSMDGLRLARYVRDRYPPVVIAIVSGAVTPALADLPDRTFFMAKPFDPRQVLSEIERMSA